jgi:uncharacterized membrane protein (DUF2068 family)
MKLSFPSEYIGLRVIGILKLLSGVAALLLGIEILRVFAHDPAPALERFVGHLHLDPHNHLIHSIIGRLTGIDKQRLHAAAAGTVLYALLHLVEGIGLIMERHWASYLVIAATSSLVPFEIYELFQKLNFLRVSLLILNCAIVVYLIAVLRKQHVDRSRPGIRGQEG